MSGIAETDGFDQDYYVSDGVLLNWGLINDHYYVKSDIAQQIEAQFNSGGLYEVDAKDEEK